LQVLMESNDLKPANVASIVIQKCKYKSAEALRLYYWLYLLSYKGFRRRY